MNLTNPDDAAIITTLLDRLKTTQASLAARQPTVDAAMKTYFDLKQRHDADQREAYNIADAINRLLGGNIVMLPDREDIRDMARFVDCIERLLAIEAIGQGRTG